jgi:hypothetical protein
MGRLGFSKFDAKLVLDHNEGRTRDTTDEHYNWEQSLPEKFAILTAWNNLIDGTSAPSDLALYTAERKLASRPQLLRWRG